MAHGPGPPPPLVDQHLVAVYAVAFGLAAGGVFFNPAASSVLPSIVDEDELRMYEALVRAQQRRPPEAAIEILPGTGFRAAERTFWPDFVVTHRERVGIIEVDGPKHRNRAAADQSRDRQLQDAGVVLTDRIMVEDTDEATELDRFVEHFLARLLTR